MTRQINVLNLLAIGTVFFTAVTDPACAEVRKAAPVVSDGRLTARAEAPAAIKNPVQKAASLISNKNYTQAQKVLLEFVRQVPADWVSLRESETGPLGFFWNKEEYLSYSAYYSAQNKGTRKAVTWLPDPSYSEAFYQLGWLAVEQNDYQGALINLDRALKLEPDHPVLYTEKAFVMKKLKRYGEARDLFLKGASVRPWTSVALRARAMRGAAMSLASLKQWAEAEAQAKKAMELEPKNGMNERTIRDIRAMRSKEKPAAKPREKK